MTVCFHDHEYSTKFKRSLDRWLFDRQSRLFNRYRFSRSRISSSLCDVKELFRFDDERFWFAKNDTSQTVQFMNKKENQRFFSNSDMFSRNCYVLSVIDLLNELAHLFFFVWRKEWKRLSFSKINDNWWWFDFWRFFVFLFLWSFDLLFFFNLRIVCIS